MSLRQLAVATLALLSGVEADSCCFVVQDDAHEVYWPEYVTEIYTSAVDLTSITTLLTPYPNSTITNYETNVYPTSQVFTTSSLVTENPVALYPNPAYAVPQKTEILVPSESVETGGVTVASPTGFRVYSTAKVFTAPAVTDSNGNVACGTLSSFSNVATDAAACVPTFTGINSNAAAYFDTNGGQGVEISLTAPFIHVPTRAALQISETEVCVQGNGTENYGYPAQELISHLASNAFYSAQYPGIESCLPAGPSIKAVNALAISITAGSASGADPPDPPASTINLGPLTNGSTASTTNSGSTDTTINGASTETPGGGLTSSTTVVVTPNGATTTSVTSTSASSTSATALSDVLSATSSTSTSGEAPLSGGLLPTSSSPTSASTASSFTPQSAVLPASTTVTSSSTSFSSTSTVTLSPVPVTNSTVASSSVVSNGTSTLSTSSGTTSSSSSGTSTTSQSSTSSSSLSISTASTSSPGKTTSAAVSASTVVVNGTTAVVSGTSTSGLTSPSPVQAVAGTQYVSWELIFGLMGLVIGRIW